MNKVENINPLVEGRLMSLDFFRGLTMFILVGSGFYQVFVKHFHNDTVIHKFFMLFDHPAWIGLTIWDFILPAFVFIVGVAMPFAFSKRLERGDSWKKIFNHVVKRCLLLVFLALVLTNKNSNQGLEINLVQALFDISFTYFVAFLVLRFKIATQIIIAFLVIIFYDLAYQLFSVPGFDQPYEPGKSLGYYVDILFMGKYNSHLWVTIGVIPQTFFAIWGVVVGKTLRQDYPPMNKFKMFASIGIFLIIMGIFTSSIVLVTAGSAILLFAIFYWLIDIKCFRKYLTFFNYVGMNPLFIYLLSQFGVKSFVAMLVTPFLITLLGWSGVFLPKMIAALMGWLFLWYVSYWLYQHKVFIKL
jgi:predicted acyltransferase